VNDYYSPNSLRSSSVVLKFAQNFFLFFTKTKKLIDAHLQRMLGGD